MPEIRFLGSFGEDEIVLGDYDSVTGYETGEVRRANGSVAGTISSLEMSEDMFFRKTGSTDSIRIGPILSQGFRNIWPARGTMPLGTVLPDGTMIVGKNFLD